MGVRGWLVIVGAVAEGLPEEVLFAAIAGGRAARPSEYLGEGYTGGVVGDSEGLPAGGRPALSTCLTCASFSFA